MGINKRNNKIINEIRFKINFHLYKYLQFYLQFESIGFCENTFKRVLLFYIKMQMKVLRNIF